MAEALVSGVLEHLAAFTCQQIEQEWSRISGIEEKVESLTSNLEDIQVVLVDAEKRQIKDGSVKRWLDKLKAVSYEIDSVLDEWNTAIILRSNLKFPSKVCFFTNPCFHRNRVHRLGLRRRTACKIEKLNKKLVKISDEKKDYTFGTATYSIEYERRPNTTSFVDASEVYGRDTEKNVLLSKLLSESSQAARRGPDIVPIVGMGGIGKTTLAQLVYNDEKVNDHFQLRIWVCVSDPFDEITIARAIAEALNVKDAHKMVGFQALLKSIHESIKGKRYLLVLDDVWTEDHRKWEGLERSLMNGPKGSKIIVTTRKEEVAIMMKVKDNIISLKHLSDEVCLSIFNKLAFLDNKEKCEEMKKMGDEIALKCNGLPLVAKALGSLLCFKKYTIEHWKEVLNSELWKLGDRVENEVFVPFLLSYNDLPPLEKRCFLYCSYFPKDYTIDRDELIQLWMSLGYLRSTKDDERNIGIDCFENLVKRSFFQDFVKDEDGNIITCKMHDIVHDFVLFLTKREYLNSVIKTKDDEMKLLQAKVFHCTLLIESGQREIPTSIYSHRNLRTLCVRNTGSIKWDLLLKLTCLRTLDLSHSSFSRIPKDIDKLILLRYLNLSHPRSDFIELPKTLGNLFNLQTLKLEGCRVKLPKEIEKLVNLRHLYFGEFGRVQCPKELGKLTGLETLDYINLANGRMKLEDLNKLNNLKRSLLINPLGRTKDDEAQAERAQLNSKERLFALVLSFLYFGEKEDQHPLILEALHPHPNLKRLEISFYCGTRMFPSWMTSLINLKRLVLDSCFFCESLGPFGNLPSLESLFICGLLRVERVGQEFLGIEEDTTKTENGSPISISFPKLKKLELNGLGRCKEWEWCASSNRNTSLIIMPCLVSLEIRYCDKLKAPLPEFLRRTPLKNFTIKGCRLLEQHFEQGVETKDLVYILTSAASQFNITSTNMAKSESCRDGPVVDDDEKEQEINLVP